jgi:hypothetical protein
MRDRNAPTAVTRPFAAAIRRRHGTPALSEQSESKCPHTYWLWRVSVEGRDEDWLWDAHVALVAHTSRLDLPSSAAVRQRLAGLDDLREVAAQKAVDLFRERMRAPLATAIARERAIAAGLAAQERTLATSLVQRGLFDSRAERHAIEWRTVVGRAADRSTERLAELGRFQSAAAAKPQLVFAVIVD